jgi:hypothetical protein
MNNVLKIQAELLKDARPDTLSSSICNYFVGQNIQEDEGCTPSELPSLRFCVGRCFL